MQLCLADRHQGVTTLTINTSTSGDATLVAAPATGRIRVLGGAIQNGAASAMTVILKDGSTERIRLTFAPTVGDNKPLNVHDNGHMDTTQGSALTINLSAATLVTGYIRYIVIP